TSDLGSAALHFDDAGESFGYVLLYELDLDHFAVAVVRGGASKRLLHIPPTAYVRPERVPQRHVVRWRIQRLVDTRVTREYRAGGHVALFDRSGEVACWHSTVLLSSVWAPAVLAARRRCHESKCKRTPFSCRLSAELLGESDEKPFRPADVAEPIRFLVLY